MNLRFSVGAEDLIQAAVFLLFCLSQRTAPYDYQVLDLGLELGLYACPDSEFLIAEPSLFTLFSDKKLHKPA